MELINYVYLLFAIVYIVDISGAINDFKKKIWILFNGRNIEYTPKSYRPLDCSKCLVFWIFIGIGIYNSEGLINTLILACLGAYLTYFVNITLKGICELYNALIVKITGN